MSVKISRVKKKSDFREEKGLNLASKILYDTTSTCNKHNCNIILLKCHGNFGNFKKSDLAYSIIIVHYINYIARAYSFID